MSENGWEEKDGGLVTGRRPETVDQTPTRTLQFPRMIITITIIITIIITITIITTWPWRENF